MLRIDVVPDSGLQTREALLTEAAAFRTAMANSKIRLFKSTLENVSETTAKAALVAAEADFNGYPAGGVTLLAWNEPLADGVSSVVIYAPLAQFNFLADDPFVTGLIGGYWVEDATGNVRQVVKFNNVVSMLNDGNSLPIVAGRRFGPR